MNRLVTQLLALIEASEFGIDTYWLGEEVGGDPRELGDALEEIKSAGRVHGLGGVWLTEAAVERLATAIAEQCGEAIWTPADEVWRGLGLDFEGKGRTRVLEFLQRRGLVRWDGRSVGAMGVPVPLKSRQAELLERVRAEVETMGVEPVGEEDLAKLVGVPKQAVHQVVEMGLAGGAFVRVTEGVVTTFGVVERLEAETLARFGHGAFTVSAWREAMGTSRKYAIPMLGLLDARGFTQLDEDVRRVIRR